MRFFLCLFLLNCLLACGDNDKQEESMGRQMNLSSNPDKKNDYSPVVKGKEFEFPYDHLPHANFRLEWWYLTANLVTEYGDDIGIQWTQFRVALAPKPPQSIAAWQTRQLFFAHSAVTGKNFHHFSEKWSRQHPHFADVYQSPFSVFLDNWRWQSESELMFPATLSVTSSPNESADSAFSYQLNLVSEAQFQLQGEQGYSSKINDGSVASYYYSQPFIDINGVVKVNNKSFKVAGKGWLDREWSSKYLNESQKGWDWFALRLNENTCLMLFQLREYDEKNQPNHYYTGKLMFANGEGRVLTKEQIKMQVKKLQPIDGRRYPVQWHIQIEEEDIDLKIKAINQNSLMDMSVSYWEGPVSFTGSHQGKGYMELTGY